MFQRNVHLKPSRKTSGWRKVSQGSWRPMGESSIFAEIELEIDSVESDLAILNEDRVHKIKLTHYIGWVIARAIERHPQINSMIRFGKIYPRRDIDLFFHVACDHPTGPGEDLRGIVVRQANQKTVPEFASEFDRLVKQVRLIDQDPFAKIKKIFSFLPGFLSRAILDFTSFIFYSLNIWSPLFGAPRDSFGSIMITNMGSLGIDRSFGPIAPYTRIPMVVSIGRAREKLVLRGEKPQNVRVISLGFNCDHRIVDGYHMGGLIEAIRERFKPEKSLKNRVEAPLSLAKPQPNKRSSQTQLNG